MVNPLDLSGKHILITGGSSGIGRACAIQAGKLEAKVTLVARNAERLEQTRSMMEHPDRHACYPFDLTQNEQIEALVGQIVQERGPLDGLCHAAGIVVGRPLKMNNLQFVESMLRIHTLAYMELVRCASLKKNLNEGASIVGISSAAVERGDATWSAYAAAKAAMNGFIGSAAPELAKRGIRINNVAYAMVATDSYHEFIQNSASTMERIMGGQYMGPIELTGAANTVMFLLSDAVRQLTATTINVFGGR